MTTVLYQRAHTFNPLFRVSNIFFYGSTNLPIANIHTTQNVYTRQNPKKQWKPYSLKHSNPNHDYTKLHAVRTPGYKPSRAPGHAELPPQYTLDSLQKVLAEQNITNIEEKAKTDLPIEGLPNPYAKMPRKCILCDCKAKLDYKNTRLLSQFVSSHTGHVYGRHITGLCLFMQTYVRRLVLQARRSGLMPFKHKTPEYMEDPKLFNPFRRIRD